MTQEDEQLLLVDLCGRLPYGVEVKCPSDDEPYTLLSINWNKEIAVIGFIMDRMYVTSKQKLVDIKPYLRPISSMTEEEKEELRNTYAWLYGDYPFDDEDEDEDEDDAECHPEPSVETYDWYNKKMFDYRGLIPKGLAIAVTKDNDPHKD